MAATDIHASVLTSPHGLQLCVLPRPHRLRQYLVAPMLPAGCNYNHILGVPAPRCIAVGDQPAGAAEEVRRRMMFNYRIAAMQAMRHASPNPLRVTCTFDAAGRPRVTATYGRALYELLGQRNFLLDPATGECHLPQTLSLEQAVREVHQTAARLRALGFTLDIGIPHGTTESAGKALSGDRAVLPPSPAAPPKGPSR
ncbi:hypothetical protein CTU88_14210 [Streptomyces sp. JV178]|uniref:hypothetical protein n=1 Tax=Streptomyces sp. JV178 TaxID=858632 RepID=UPI000C1B26B0|nr:hypothetical protein [Streptomyces sp. JV178]PIM71278.1 hypothetical protein CTU88_14210 [Streptomyces sp. JV178]